jgi:8-oxo-dGTP pyrophosphatase MutT (NUDIX family)
MNFKNIPNKPYNTEDGIIYASRSVSVNSVIFIRFATVDDTYILLSKRSKTMMDEPGKWCLPCGYLDFNETIQEATIRETFEETGFYVNDYLNHLEIDKPNYIIDDNINSNRQNIAFTSIKLYNNLPSFPKLLDKTNESDANNWVSISKLDGFALAFNHKALIKQTFKYINTCI